MIIFCRSPPFEGGKFLDTIIITRLFRKVVPPPACLPLDDFAARKMMNRHLVKLAVRRKSASRRINPSVKCCPGDGVWRVALKKQLLLTRGNIILVKLGSAAGRDGDTEFSLCVHYSFAVRTPGKHHHALPFPFCSMQHGALLVKYVEDRRIHFTMQVHRYGSDMGMIRR